MEELTEEIFPQQLFKVSSSLLPKESTYPNRLFMPILCHWRNVQQFLTLLPCH